MKFKVGDRVYYYPTKGAIERRETVVRSIHPNGIPSFPKPMVMIEGQAGVVDAAQCELVPPRGREVVSKHKCAVCGKIESGNWPLTGWMHHAKDPNGEVAYCSEACAYKSFPALSACDNDPFEAAKLIAQAPKESQ